MPETESGAPVTIIRVSRNYVGAANRWAAAAYVLNFLGVCLLICDWTIDKLRSKGGQFDPWTEHLSDAALWCFLIGAIFVCLTSRALVIIRIRGEK